MVSAPLPYSPDLETIEPDEAEVQQDLIKAFSTIIDTTNRDYGHAFRSVHAKSHALLEGELTVLPDLPDELRQGLFATAASHPVLIRISTNPGDPLPDSISVPRGLALKVLEVDLDRLPGSEGDRVQDFVLANGPAFFAPDAKAFLKNLKLLAATTDRAELGKKVLSAVLRGTEKAIEAVGGEIAPLKAIGGYPNSHPLGERYFSQVPIRYGDYVAKIAVVPLSANFKALEGKEIEIAGRDDALREDIAELLSQHGGAWELRVQLRRDVDRNPIEDASALWPEDDNPYIAVATISVAPQTSWSIDRAMLLDDRTSFSPWHGINAHRPLGSVMRARKPAYEASAEQRGRLNGCPMHQPRHAEPLPA